MASSRPGSPRQPIVCWTRRLSLLDQQAGRWSTPDGAGLAARGDADEARRTLALLSELYEQEERLWTYYQALGQRTATRDQLADQKAALERHMAEQRRQLSRLDGELDRLRPPEPGAAPLRFAAGQP